MRKLSIIIPVFNVEETLKRCIESILMQAYADWELWLVDDGSTDSSGDICDVYSKQDSRIHVIHKKNEGVSSARNIGIDNATGRYVMFVDSDDYLEGDSLETMINFAEGYDADIVMCGFFYHFEESGEIKPNFVKNTFVGGNSQFVSVLFKEALERELLNPPWNKVIKKKVLEQNQIRFISEYSICEDMIFTMKLLSVSTKIVSLNVPLYHYIYKKGENLVNRFHKNFYEALSAYYELMKRYLETNGALDVLHRDINKLFVDKTISYFKKIYSYDGYDTKTKYRELKRIGEDIRNRDVLCGYKPMGGKKQLVLTCLRYHWYRLLHLLYIATQ